MVRGLCVTGLLTMAGLAAACSKGGDASSRDAEVHLDQIKKGVKAWMPEHAAFPVGTTGLTPRASCCEAGRSDHRCAPDPSLWSDGPWADLDVSVDEPGAFQYSYSSSDGRSFTATAVGDPSCSGHPVTFTLTGTLDAQGNASFAIQRP